MSAQLHGSISIGTNFVFSYDTSVVANARFRVLRMLTPNSLPKCRIGHCPPKGDVY